MGGKEHNKKSQMLSHKLVSLFLIACTACFFIFIFSLSEKLKRENQANNWNNKHYEEGNTNGNRNSNIPEQKQFEGWRRKVKACNYSDGRWVQDAKMKGRYSHKCKEIFKGWNCIANNKSNARDALQWRWQPWGCDLPLFDPIQFLEHFRDTSIGFVGDSLNRNMFVSLVCMLKEVSNDVRKWRPARADRGFTFLQYNVTLAYHRTNLLARYGRWSAKIEDGALEQLGYKEGYVVDVDIPDGSWAEAPSYHDILILNTGHWWWAPAKFDPVKSPMLFFEKGQPILPPKSPEEGLDMALQNMACLLTLAMKRMLCKASMHQGFLLLPRECNIDFVEKSMPKNALKLFRTQSPRHFEGGDWNEGGTCRRVKPLLPEEVEHMFVVERHSPNIEVRFANSHLRKALKTSNFHLLDITYMSEFRADAHPSTSGGKKHEDCMHWCLPGITDYWNDLLMVTLLNERIRVS